jgi:signal peptidase II
MQAAPGTPLNDSDAHPATDNRVPATRHLVLFGATAVVVYGLDVATKAIAIRLLTDRPPVELFGGLLTLRLTANPGAAFSLGTSLTVAFSLIAAAVVVGLLVLARRIGSPLWALALGLLLGGAAGNLTDRLVRDPGPLRGHVVDFLALPHWPVFNVADSAVVAAGVLIVVQSLRGVHLDGSRAKP